eukprot:CAMPEP_0175916260 /NCGR_PEP_ID=MMETSP0108-20121206/10748_1 /TAXON_ID=195067 ORGANISM="Goniomonas pacifica, Strain CCMP1869" /NCGR_SAMPLE_ID=MMETSP0108 /ASSEMBLY_ACC=CAM_ASM_000204 /LENGTH=54 /DNA_ID=CAMNT_0017238793 /DNA_START=284 /DNA_END=444 /DNA_ORIENTATION=+
MSECGRGCSLKLRLMLVATWTSFNFTRGRRNNRGTLNLITGLNMTFQWLFLNAA